MAIFSLRDKPSMKSSLFVACLIALWGIGGYIDAQNAAASTGEQQITVKSPATQNVSEGSPPNFTGKVQIQALFGVLAPGRSTGGMVTFQPGARTAWHTHPLGQVLIVTDGEGWIQEWGSPRRVIRKGDVVQIPAGVKHWHGATATSSMTHIALQEMSEGKNVVWMEPVTESQYNQRK